MLNLTSFQRKPKKCSCVLKGETIEFYVRQLSAVELDEVIAFQEEERKLENDESDESNASLFNAKMAVFFNCDEYNIAVHTADDVGMIAANTPMQLLIEIGNAGIRYNSNVTQEAIDEAGES